MADQQLLRLRDVQAITGLSRSSIYRFADGGTFLRPIRLGERASAWVAAEVQKWIDYRVRQSRGEQAAVA